MLIKDKFDQNRWLSSDFIIIEMNQKKAITKKNLPFKD